MTDPRAAALDAKCHKCGAEAGAACRTPKGAVHKHGTHDGRGRQLTDGTRHYYTPTEVRNLLYDAIRAERAECAKVCEVRAGIFDDSDLGDNSKCAAAIRARLDG